MGNDPVVPTGGDVCDSGGVGLEDHPELVNPHRHLFAIDVLDLREQVQVPEALPERAVSQREIQVEEQSLTQRIGAVEGVVAPPLVQPFQRGDSLDMGARRVDGIYGQAGAGALGDGSHEVRRPLVDPVAVAMPVIAGRLTCDDPTGGIRLGVFVVGVILGTDRDVGTEVGSALGIGDRLLEEQRHVAPGERFGHERLGTAHGLAPAIPCCLALPGRCE